MKKLKSYNSLMIRNRLLIAFGVLISLLIGMSLFTVMQISKIHNTYYELLDLYLERQQIISGASTELLGLCDANHEKLHMARDVVSTRPDIDVRENYDAHVESFLGYLNAYRENVDADRYLTEEQKEERLLQTDQIEDLFKHNYQTVVVALDAALSQGGMPELSMILTESSPIAIKIFGKLHTLQDYILLSVIEKSHEAATHSRDVTLSVINTAVLLLLISFFVSAVTTRVIKTPITEMKKAMAVMDYLDPMVSVIDFDYRLLYMNRSAYNAFGVESGSCIGEKCYKALRNLDAPCDSCRMPQLMAEKNRCPSIDYDNEWDEVLGTWKGGRAAITRWVDGSLVFINADNDITERKNYQEQLREAVEAAEAASAAKSAFLANMSHEIRTPLNVVVGLADIKLEEDGVPEDTKETLRKMRAAGNTLLCIVNDILDISKIESGKLTLSPEEYHLASLLNDASTLITTRIGEKPITFSLDISDDLPNKLYGDDLRVKQILSNLLSNAVKYTNNGTIELGVYCRRENSDVWMEIVVSDTGVGIKGDDIRNLFSDYYQVDSQATRKIEGTGLGLSITKRLAEMMDGNVSVASEYGEGSTFRVNIRQGFVNAGPIGPVSAENLRRFRYSDKKRRSINRLVRDDLSYAKVLVVDDMRANLDVSAGLMRKYKMQVDCVTNGQAAIERVTSRDPVYSAIFMDHMMPGMDGIETVDKIRALGTEYALGVPIIALTANAIAGTEELFYSHGFQAFLPKPIDIMQLDAVLMRWVKKGGNGNAY